MVPSPEVDGEAPKAASGWTNSAIMAASAGLTALSKIGVKDKPTLKRLAKMMMWANAALEEFFIQRDTLTNTWAERDEAGEVKIERSSDGKSQAPMMRNGVEYQLAANELLRGEATYTSDPPEPFTWDDIEKFVKLPDAQVIAQLGPFVKF